MKKWYYLADFSNKNLVKVNSKNGETNIVLEDIAFEDVKFRNILKKSVNERYLILKKNNQNLEIYQLEENSGDLNIKQTLNIEDIEGELGLVLEFGFINNNRILTFSSKGYITIHKIKPKTGEIEILSKKIIENFSEKSMEITSFTTDIRYEYLCTSLSYKNQRRVELSIHRIKEKDLIFITKLIIENISEINTLKFINSDFKNILSLNGISNLKSGSEIFLFTFNKEAGVLQEILKERQKINIKGVKGLCVTLNSRLYGVGEASKILEIENFSS